MIYHKVLLDGHYADEYKLLYAGEDNVTFYTSNFTISGKSYYQEPTQLLPKDITKVSIEDIENHLLDGGWTLRQYENKMLDSVGIKINLQP